MYLEKRREWIRRRRRQKMIQRLLILAGVILALAVGFSIIKKITGHDVVQMVSEQAEKERPDGLLPVLEFSNEGAKETTAAVPETEAPTETEPPTNPALNEEWMLILVNKDHPIPNGYEVPAFTELRNSNRVDSRIYPALQKMFDDARADGALPYITSSYRSMDKQQQLMDEKIIDYQSEGHSRSEAVKLAEAWVAIPGTSEHQLGLCVDISTEDHSEQEPEVVWNWLKNNSWKYGFIQRYPEDKTEVTGIINEPWHYRYVGESAAKEMTEKGLVLEEYLAQR